MPRVAIVQNRVILGGRLSVILSLIDHLNRRGIEPDLLCGQAPAADVIEDRYGESARFRIVELPGPPPLPTDFDVPQFNRRVSHRLSSYDLVINTSNSLALLDQEKAPVLHYVFFPRRRRAESEGLDIHMPEETLGALDPRRLLRAFHRRLYRGERIAPGTKVVAISEFVRDAVLTDFEVPEERLAIVYPPVDPARFDPSKARAERVVSLGRFQPYKRQLEQLEIARSLPDVGFSLVGFVTSQRYFERCERYRSTHSVTNAELLASAPFERTRELLQTSRYFLHSVVNEPFGLTTLEAVLAGCVPVVHDSGGQREIVPDPSLRFSSPAEAVALLRRLVADPPAPDVNEQLRERAARLFSRDAFHERVGAVLDGML